MIRSTVANTSHEKVVVAFLILVADRHTTRLRIYMSGLALPAERSFCAVGLASAIENLFLNHDMAIAAHALKV